VRVSLLCLLLGSRGKQTLRSFNPLRRRVQIFIDHSFYRRKYDAAKTLEAFSAKLREETDMDNLNSELLSTVRETVQPEHVSLWLRPNASPKSEPTN
jgi:hypothetical protein